MQFLLYIVCLFGMNVSFVSLRAKDQVIDPDSSLRPAGDSKETDEKSHVPTAEAPLFLF